MMCLASGSNSRTSSPSAALLHAEGCVASSSTPSNLLVQVDLLMVCRVRQSLEPRLVHDSEEGGSLRTTSAKAS